MSEPFTISDPRSPIVGTTRTTEPASDDWRTPEQKEELAKFFPNSPRPTTTPDGDKLYRAHPTMQHAYRQATDQLRSVIGVSEPAIVADQKNFSDMLDALDLDAFSIGRPLYAAAIEADVAAVRGTEPSDEQIQEWKEVSRRILNAMGPDMGPRYEKFAQSDPRLAALLNKRGVGVRPTVVRLIAEHLRNRGYR